MLQKFVSVFGGDPNKRTVEKLAPLVDEMNALEPEFEQLSDEVLRANRLVGRKIVFGHSQEIPRLFKDFSNFIGTKPCDFIIIAQHAPSKGAYQ